MLYILSESTSMDAFEKTSHLLDDIVSWKLSLRGLRSSSSYDDVLANLDAVEVLIRSVINNATTISDVGSMLADGMVDVLDTISSTKAPDNRTEERVQKRLEGLKKTCVNMIRNCENFEKSFSHISDRLKNIGQELDQKEAELEKEIRELRAEKRNTWISGIKKCVAAVAISAAAVFFEIPIITGGVALGTRFAAAGIASGITSAMQICWTKIECDRYKARIESLLLEGDTLQKISEGMSNCSNGITEITAWWRTVQGELIRLESLYSGPGMPWGSSPETAYSISDWESLGRRFEEYSKGMSGGVKAETPPPAYEAVTD